MTCACVGKRGARVWGGARLQALVYGHVLHMRHAALNAWDQCSARHASIFSSPAHTQTCAIDGLGLWGEKANTIEAGGTQQTTGRGSNLYKDGATALISSTCKPGQVVEAEGSWRKGGLLRLALRASHTLLHAFRDHRCVYTHARQPAGPQRAPQWTCLHAGMAVLAAAAAPGCRHAAMSHVSHVTRQPCHAAMSYVSDRVRTPAHAQQARVDMFTCRHVLHVLS